jgi:hypothetical protein
LATNSLLFSQSVDDSKKRYYIESAIIKYKYSGNTKGTEEIKFDRWGEREYQRLDAVTTTKFFGIKNVQKENTLNILVGDYSYSIDMENKTGVKTLNAGITTVSEISGDKSPRQFGEDMLKSIGGKIIGEEEILGKKCDIWKAIGVKVWIWKGLPLKVSSKILGIKRYSEATEIQVDVKLEDSLFKVPEGIKIIDYTK